METTLVKTEDIAVEFALGTERKDIELLLSLLSEDGRFTVQDDKRETIFVNRQEFMKWYESKLDDATITEIDYDQCLFCIVGNKVVLFNGGRFPVMFKEDGERSRTGLMIELKDGKISGLNFCRAFLRTTNKAVYECRGEKIKGYMAQGLSVDGAIKKAKGLSPDELF